MFKIRMILFALILVCGKVPVALAQSVTPLRKNGSREKMCGLETYHDSLTLAFKNATIAEGENLVTVQVLPSFQREYALVLKQVGSDVRLIRATFQEQLWSHLGALAVLRTRRQCLDMAIAAKVETVTLSVRPETVHQLWTAFRSISLETDTCPRRKNECALVLDGTDFVIQTNDGGEVRLTEIGNLRNIKSENAPMLDWVHALLQTVNNAHSQ